MTQPRITPICSVCQNPYETYQKRDGSLNREFCSKACANKAKASRAAQTLWEKKRGAGDMQSPRFINTVPAEEHAAKKSEPRSLCECGCGQLVKRVGRRYIFGHYANITRTSRITKRCLWCSKEFSVPENYEDRHHYCSKSCQMKYQLTGQRRTEWVKRICPICETEYETSARDLEVGRRATCSYACGIEATRRSKLKSDTGHPVTRETQREATLQLRQTCDHCGYGEIVDLLIIHHVDHNTRNGAPQNILLLCPMCHSKEHYRLKTGWYSINRHGSKEALKHLKSVT